MDTLSAKFSKMHTSLSELFKKLMKNTKCKEKLLLWMRKVIVLNSDKKKSHSHTPLASDGFFYNYIDTLLILCKPFTGDFTKFANFLGKINCFYLANNDNITNARIVMDKIDHEAENDFDSLVDLGSDFGPHLSGFTINPVA